jgi:hypothetical protein
VPNYGTHFLTRKRVETVVRKKWRTFADCLFVGQEWKVFAYRGCTCKKWPTFASRIIHAAKVETILVSRGSPQKSEPSPFPLFRDPKGEPLSLIGVILAQSHRNRCLDAIPRGLFECLFVYRGSTVGSNRSHVFHVMSRVLEFYHYSNHIGPLWHLL